MFSKMVFFVKKLSLDFVTFLTVGFRGGSFHVGINFEGRVKSTLPDKLNSRWESLSRKMTSKKLQSRVSGSDGGTRLLVFLVGGDRRVRGVRGR